MSKIYITDNSGGFTSSVRINPVHSDRIDIIYKAELYNDCCCYRVYSQLCCRDITTTGLFVLENALESYDTNWCNFFFPRTTKYFYDEFPFKRHCCEKYCYCCTGHRKIHANSTKRVCCCIELSDCMNDCCECHYAPCCGDRISITVGDTCCCCIPLNATCLTNCCSLCGPKTGQPLCKFQIYTCLAPGTAETLAESINNSRQKYRERAGIDY